MMTLRVSPTTLYSLNLLEAMAEVLFLNGTGII